MKDGVVAECTTASPGSHNSANGTVPLTLASVHHRVKAAGVCMVVRLAPNATATPEADPGDQAEKK